MILKEFRSSSQGLNDLLNYAHFIDDGIILNKDGAFLTGFRFRGPDMNSATEGEMDALVANVNRAFTYLSDGWMVHCDEIRIPSTEYPEPVPFPCSTAALIDEERRQHYEDEGTHFENIQFFTFVWKFPLNLTRKTRHLFIEGVEKEDDTQSLHQLLLQFKEVIQRCLSLLKLHFILEPLNSKDLLTFLNLCISGEFLSIEMPPEGCFLDVALGRRDVTGGFYPTIGDKHIYTLTINGYLNKETSPALLEELATYPCVYRWSNRFIPMSQPTAEKEIKRYQKYWSNKITGFMGVVKEVITGKESKKFDSDAAKMKIQTDLALENNSSQAVRFGFWTSVIVLIDQDKAVLDTAVSHISEYLEQRGFTSILETVNALDAWLGSIPGHGSANARRLFLHSANLAQVWPLYTVWAGAATSASTSLLPKNSPPLFYGATAGRIPFRFNLDVDDVGHQVILGPTGAGKSTLLDLMISQFLRYPDAHIFVFDKDYSHRGLTEALEGQYYDFADTENLALCPLADLSTERRRINAAAYMETLIELQHTVLTPEIRAAVMDAIEVMARDENLESRNLTVFLSQVQHEQVRAALRFYTIKGQFKALDATEDRLKLGYLQAFEMGWLLEQRSDIYLPVLAHLFNHIDNFLEESNGKKPTLIILEEAWLYIEHPIFARKLRDWLKTLRKKNARVIFATQALSDLYNPETKTLTPVTAVIMDSCPTKIYLPNRELEAENRVLYQKMGLNDRQIDIINRLAEPKRHYYVVSREGKRLIELGFTGYQPMALTFVGLSKERSMLLVDYKTRYGQAWIYHWLKDAGFIEWADYWKGNLYNSHVAEVMA